MNADLVDRIETLAGEKGLSLSRIERTLGLGNGTIRRWKHQSPRLDRLLLVAQCLDVSLDFLVSGTGTAAPMSGQVPVTIGSRIRSRRQSLGLTLKQVADREDLHTGNLSELENDKYLPSVPALIAISHALDVSVDWLLGLTQDVPDPALSREEEQLLAACRALPPAARLDVLDYALFKLRRRPESPKSGSGDAR